MSLLEQARADYKEFIGLSDGGGTEIILTPTVGDPVTTKGIVGTHRASIDPETGTLVNSKNSHFSISESTLVDLGYPVRNENSELNMEDHKVEFKDSAGIDRTYRITQQWPDETLGVLVFILGE